LSNWNFGLKVDASALTSEVERHRLIFTISGAFLLRMLMPTADTTQARIIIQLPLHLRKQVEAIAKTDERSLSAIARRAIEKEVASCKPT
jgi:hypothetical protein